MFNIFVILTFFTALIDGFTLLNNGKFKRQIEITKLEVYNNESSPFQAYLSYRKFNRTNIAFTTNITITDYIDKRYRFKLEVQKWGDGGWKHNLVNYENTDPCKQFKLTIGPLFKTIMDFMKHPPKCPFQPGFYHFEDFAPIANKNEVAPVFLNLGKHKLLIDIFKGKAWLNRYEQDLEILEIN